LDQLPRRSGLEGSKIFAKDFMARHGIPTAAYRVADSPGRRLSFCAAASLAVLIRGRYQGGRLAAGKGVVVAATRAEAEKAWTT
jgi:phosphoribosylamine--glycine ligase